MANNQNSQSNKQQKQRSGGNFKNDPQRASEAGRKGGQRSRSGGHSRNTNE